MVRCRRTADRSGQGIPPSVPRSARSVGTSSRHLVAGSVWQSLIGVAGSSSHSGSSGGTVVVVELGTVVVVAGTVLDELVDEVGTVLVDEVGTVLVEAGTVVVEEVVLGTLELVVLVGFTVLVDVVASVVVVVVSSTVQSPVPVLVLWLSVAAQ